jgi:hypothetical protein
MQPSIDPRLHVPAEINAHGIRGSSLFLSLTVQGQLSIPWIPFDRELEIRFADAPAQVAPDLPDRGMRVKAEMLREMSPQRAGAEGNPLRPGGSLVPSVAAHAARHDVIGAANRGQRALHARTGRLLGADEDEFVLMRDDHGVKMPSISFKITFVADAASVGTSFANLNTDAGSVGHESGFETGSWKHAEA